MNAQASIQVNADPEKALECAYETLLSMREPSKFLTEKLNRIDKKLLFASVSGKFKPTNFSSYKIVCLITIERLIDSSCRLTITADKDIIHAHLVGSCPSIALISDFFEQFSKNIES